MWTPYVLIWLGVSVLVSPFVLRMWLENHQKTKPLTTPYCHLELDRYGTKRVARDAYECRTRFNHTGNCWRSDNAGRRPVRTLGDAAVSVGLSLSWPVLAWPVLVTWMAPKTMLERRYQNDLLAEKRKALKAELEQMERDNKIGEVDDPTEAS